MRPPISQRVSLVLRYAEWRQEVEFHFQEWLKPGGRGVGGVEEVVDLVASRLYLRDWERQ